MGLWLRVQTFGWSLFFLLLLGSDFFITYERLPSSATEDGENHELLGPTAYQGNTSFQRALKRGARVRATFQMNEGRKVLPDGPSILPDQRKQIPSVRKRNGTVLSLENFCWMRSRTLARERSYFHSPET